MNTHMLALEVLQLDVEIQPRTTMNPDTIATYAELFAEGCELAPIVVYTDGRDWWVADGFHRVEAARPGGLRRDRG